MKAIPVTLVLALSLVAAPTPVKVGGASSDLIEVLASGPGVPPTFPLQPQSLLESAIQGGIGTGPAVLNLAHQVIEHHRLRLGDSSVNPAWFNQQELQLRAAETLSNMNRQSYTTELEKAVALAKEATLQQATVLGIPVLEGAGTYDYALPSEALHDLALRRGIHLSDEARAELGGLDSLAQPQRSALAHVVSAYLAFDEAATTAYSEPGDPLQYPLLAPGWTPGSVPPLAALARPQPATVKGLTDASAEANTLQQLFARPVFGELFLARHQLLDAALEFSLAFQVASPVEAPASIGPVDCPPSGAMETWLCEPPSGLGKNFDLCPLFALDAIGLDDEYATDCALILDAGGDDVYHNNAGGSSILILGDNPCEFQLDAPQTGTAAAVVDLAGSDRYGNPVAPRLCGANGGGFAGAGFLLDGGGQDAYVAQQLAVNGGAFFGLGFLLDTGGDDAYHAGVGLSCLDFCFVGGLGANGGGATGVGFLMDVGGSDQYDSGTDLACFSSSCAAGGIDNGGANAGAGFLFDGAGNDHYRSGVGVNCLSAVGCGAGAVSNGGAAFGGIGFLMDDGGSDTYEVGNNVMCSGSGVACTAGSVANGGGVEGVGFLYDSEGNDQYVVGVNVVGSCEQGACLAGYSAVNGGAHFGLGFLVDGAGNDVYRVASGSQFQCKFKLFLLNVGLCVLGAAGVNGGGFAASAGALLDASGSDTYAVADGAGLTCSTCDGREAGAPGAMIVGVGIGGVNGGGSTSSSGLLVDVAGSDVYHVAKGATFSCSNCATPEMDVLSLVGIGRLGVNGGGHQSSGLLLDAFSDGDSYYDEEGGTGVDQTVFLKGGFGEQFDFEFDPTSTTS